MSYILEALRKADAERERDRNAVPDLHAQLIPLTARATAGDADDSGAGAWLFFGGTVLALLLLAGLGWWWFAGSEPARPVAAIPAAIPAAVPAAAMQSPAPQAASAAGPVDASAASGVVGGAASAPTPVPDETEPAEPAAKSGAPSAAKATPKPKAAPAAKATPEPTSEPAPRSRAAKAAAPPAKPVAPAVPAVATKAAAPAVPAAPPARVPALAELPEALRREVPTMAIGGSVYSPEAARRMVIINGQVFVEGSQLAPQLKLERIEQKSAVFSIRGERFAMPL